MVGRYPPGYTREAYREVSTRVYHRVYIQGVHRVYHRVYLRYNQGVP